MSFRGEAQEIADELARNAEFARRLRINLLQGPVSAGVQAHLHRDVALAESSDTYAGTPSGDPYFFVFSDTFDLEAGRIYQLTCQTRLRIESAGLREAVLARDLSVAASSPSAGTGVTGHTALARWRDRWGTASDTPEGVVSGIVVPTADETDVEIALILQTGLSSQTPAPGKHRLVVADIGRT